jgi:hypothetical protein
MMHRQQLQGGSSTGLSYSSLRILVLQCVRRECAIVMSMVSSGSIRGFPADCLTFSDSWATTFLAVTSAVLSQYSI